MEIFIKNDKVQFTQGCQTFAIDYEGNEEELKWMSEQLNTAFENFMNEIKMATIHQYTEMQLKYIINCGRGNEAINESGNCIKPVMQRLYLVVNLNQISK